MKHHKREGGLAPRSRIPKRAEAGFTLIEVTIASVILVTVIMISMQMVFTATNIYHKNNNTLDLEERGRELADTLEDEFLTARFTGGGIVVGGQFYQLGAANNNTEIRFQHPIGITGAVISFGYTSPLAFPDGGLQQDLACFIRFEADEVFMESASAMQPMQPNSPDSLMFPFPALPNLEA